LTVPPPLAPLTHTLTHTLKFSFPNTCLRGTRQKQAEAKFEEKRNPLLTVNFIYFCLHSELMAESAEESIRKADAATVQAKEQAERKAEKKRKKRKKGKKVRLGRALHVLGGVLVVRSERPLNVRRVQNAIVVAKGKKKVGKVHDIFGPVSSPYVSVKIFQGVSERRLLKLLGRNVFILQR